MYFSLMLSTSQEMCHSSSHIMWPVWLFRNSQPKYPFTDRGETEAMEGQVQPPTHPYLSLGCGRCPGGGKHREVKGGGLGGEKGSREKRQVSNKWSDSSLNENLHSSFLPRREKWLMKIMCFTVSGKRSVLHSDVTVCPHQKSTASSCFKVYNIRHSRKNHI